MSQPEIFRRCLSCGASFRTGALFCPQCGNATATETPAEGVRKTAGVEPNVAAHATVTSNPNRKSRAQSQQRTVAARDALKARVKPRADKLRKASSIVLDEAASDSSIRFVLVAGVLFLLFLVLLVLSKWLG